MADTWKASEDVQELCNSLITKYHSDLEQARFIVVFSDTKPFNRDRLNFGKATKFSQFNKLFQGTKYDYCLNVCADVWQSVLTDDHKEALIDLLISCCSPEYEAEVIVENGKKKTVKDEWGMVKYTNELKLDDDGDPKWLVMPLDIVAFVDNARRYGLWFEEYVGSINKDKNGMEENS